MCDTIRHAGLAGIEKTLQIMISKLEQVEIVIKTREFYLTQKRIPLPREVDPACESAGNLMPIEVAVEGQQKVPQQ